jgi:chaperonin GroEL
MVYRPAINPQLCFVALPLKKPFVDYCEGIIKPAAADAGLRALTSSDIYGTGPIIQDIWLQIWAAAVVIADVTEKNPNVNYELGLCHAIGVPTVIVSQRIEDVPFDYRHRRCILYNTTDVDWQQRLRKQISETLKSLTVAPPKDELSWPYDTSILRTAKRVGAFISSEDAIVDVLRGTRLVRDSVARSYGPHGIWVSIRTNMGERQFKNGRSIAENTWSQNRFEMAGVNAMRTVALTMNDSIGDGTKLAILLTQAFIESGYAAIKDGHLLRDVIHGMDTAVETAIKALKSQSKSSTAPELLAVGTTAASGDKHAAILVAEAMKRAGKDGIVVVEQSPETEDSLEAIEGMQFDRGYISDEFITDLHLQEATLDNPYILISDLKISTLRQLIPLLEQITKPPSSLLIIAEDIDGEALATLKVNVEKRIIRCIGVKAPGFAERRRDILQDIAILTGGTLISRDSPASLEYISLSQLGRAKKVTVTKENTYIEGGGGSPPAIEARVQLLRREIELCNSPYDKEKLQERLAKLSGSAICVIRVRADEDSDSHRGRIVSAMNAISAAIRGGVVPGGGTALWNVRRHVLELDLPDAGKRAGLETIMEGLTYPLEQQIDNSKADLHDINIALDDKEGVFVGFNAESRQVEDLLTNGVLDPLILVTTALTTAFRQARTILQTGAWGEAEDLNLSGGELSS